MAKLMLAQAEVAAALHELKTYNEDLRSQSSACRGPFTLKE
jgi:hypothetical protein